MKEFIRNFKKQKIVGVLNISSLSLGIMVSLIIGLWSIHEMSFDNFFPDADNLFRVVTEVNLNNTRTQAIVSNKPLAEEAMEQIPEIEEMCRVVMFDSDREVRVNNQVHFDNDIIIADNQFFDFFGFPLKEGNIADFMHTSDKVIIDEKIKNKLFPGEDPIGKTIRYSGHDFTVTGIMKNIPSNSHLQGHIVFPLFGGWRDARWQENDMFCTYFRIKNKANTQHIAGKLNTICQAHLPIYKTIESKIILEPVKDIHFAQNRMFDPAVKGNKKLMYTFMLTALVILIISCINFTNLFISTSFIRSRSIGIKKSLGAGKNFLIRNFYSETCWYVLIAIIAGIGLAALTLPVFNQFVGGNFRIDFTSPFLYLFLAGLFPATVLLAGTFPAFYISNSGITDTLKGKFRGKKIRFFQKLLMIIQFTASAFLLIVVLFFNRQIDFMLSHDLGFEQENIIYLHARERFGGNYDFLKNSLLEEPSILDMTAAQELPSRWSGGGGVQKRSGAEELVIENCYIKPTYFEVMGMKFKAGENPFLLESSEYQQVCVLNETAARMLELEEPVTDKEIYYNDKPYRVGGVIYDAQVRSFHSAIDPQIYVELTWKVPGILFFKVAGNPQQAIRAIERKWKELVPDVPFTYHFLDETYQQFYDMEMKARNLFIYALSIVIIITIGGLFAMSYYSIQQRKKEISIRKINGATVRDLVILLNTDILSRVIIAIVIACPLAVLFLNNWLESFVIKIPLSPLPFLLSALISCIIALVTVNYQTWKAASANPVDAIKNE